MSDLRKKFGELLKLERERKEIKLEDLAEQLKISQSHLESIESGDIRELPSELYYGLFAKSYSEAIGIDYARTMEAMKAELEEAGDTKETGANGAQAKKKVRPEKTAEDASEEAEPSDSSGIFKWLLYIFGALALLFVIFLIVNHFFFSSKSTSTEPNQNQMQTSAEESSQTDHQINAEAANFNWNDTVGYEVPGKLKLQLVASDQSWCTILADGDTVLFRNLVAGRQYDVEASYRMLVSVGIPSLVKVRLNGVPVNLTDPQSGRISRVEITQANLHKFLSPPSEPESTSPALDNSPPVKKEAPKTEQQPQEQQEQQTPKQPVEDTVMHGGTGDGD
jgi:transcriptional regulator with XRE-family HTH domain